MGEAECKIISGLVYRLGHVGLDELEERLGLVYLARTIQETNERAQRVIVICTTNIKYQTTHELITKKRKEAKNAYRASFRTAA